MRWIEFKIKYKIQYKSSIKLFLFDVISRLLCRCFGHKWDKTDKYRQPCKRCTAIRYTVINQYKQAIGEKCVEWRVLD